MLSQILNKADYESLTQTADVIVADGHGDKVLKLANGNMLKLFRVKRAISKARIKSYAIRFQQHSKALHHRKIPTVNVIESYSIPDIDRSAVLYQPVEGLNLREIIAHRKQLDSQIIQQLAAFIAELHMKGILFRSLHLGNVVLTPEGGLALIDISDMKFSKSRLGIVGRLRNLKHLFRYKEDGQALLESNKHLFIKTYLEAASMRAFQNTIFKIGFDQLLKRLNYDL